MKKRYIWAAMAAVMVMGSLVWYGCTKDTDTEEMGTIYGTVTDYSTGQPISNASVKLRPSGETTLTGNDGGYEFNDLKAGKYSLLLSKAEYADLDDDYIIDLDAGKKVRRDVQMRKQVASLQITDMAGNSITSLDFGLEESVTSKSFNIFNNGTVNINCNLSYNCMWIDTVIAAGTTINPGQTLTVTVIIDRTKISAGENRTFLHIISNNGSNELEISATGYGAPTVTTGSVSEITATSAKCDGNASSDGGTSITNRGICWSTSNSPTIENSNHISVGMGTGSYTGMMSNLTLNTVYYVRAYATNQRGTSYGEQKQFTTLDGLPTVSTSSVSNIAATSAICGGSISSNGGFAISEKGLVWSTTQYPTLNDNHISLGNGNAAFTGTMTNLSINTTYYVRAYAVNTNGTSYGTQRTFTTTTGLPVVTINDVTSITANSAVCGGDISSDGGFAVNDKGLVWSTTQYPALTNNHISLGSGNAPFTGSMTNLSIGTTYYVRAYATNANGTTYSEQRSFTTGNGLPSVTTTAASISGGNVVSGGNVTSDGGYPVTARGICYGVYPNPDLTGAYTHTSNGTGTGYFSSVIDTNGGTIYVRAYATNANGTAYGNQITVNLDYLSLPTFQYYGHTYRVAPVANNDLSWYDADDYCDALTLFGYSDWIMPTKDQLLQMYNDRYTIGGFGAYSYWSSTEYDSYYHYRYYVIFSNGSVDYANRNALNKVRPIRLEN